jgi:hypothetical protein
MSVESLPMKPALQRLGAISGGAALFFFFLIPVRAEELPAATKREALKVVQALQKIEAENESRRSKPARRMDFSENEFNSYIAYRIDAEKEKVMKELKLKLFEANRIEGMAVIDLRGQQLPSFLKPEMTLFFEGVLVTENGWARVYFKKLFIDTQQLPVTVLDLVILAAAKASSDEAGKTNDWYLMPRGIRELKTGPKTISVFH